MIEKIKPHEFDSVFKIMELSFPSDEYRPYKKQKALLLDPSYSIYIAKTDAGTVSGFVAVWEFDSLSFIEHLAVSPECRNQGIGSKLLGSAASLFGKPVCLEVEPPSDTLSRRRIEFYKRNNFFFNAYPYVQPAIATGKNEIPLFIMTYGRAITEAEFNAVKETLYSKVYKVS